MADATGAGRVQTTFNSFTVFLQAPPSCCRENRLSDVPGTNANANWGLGHVTNSVFSHRLIPDVCDEDHRDGARTSEMGV